MGNGEASVIKGDLLLNGCCINCGSKVAKLIEMESADCSLFFFDIFSSGAGIYIYLCLR